MGNRRNLIRQTVSLTAAGYRYIISWGYIRGLMESISNHQK